MSVRIGMGSMGETTVADHTARFAEIVSGPDANINLAAAALAIAAPEYPGLDEAACLAQLDDMAAVCRGRLAADAAPARTLAVLGEVLFREQRFLGDLEHFNDPRNSFLNEVLARRRGIPITLSLVYMEVGRRLGLPVQGVSFPGHFLVKVVVDDIERVIDPFSGGAVLDQAEIERRLAQLSAPPEGWDMSRVLAAASRREILVRMLRNLKHIYVNQEDSARTLRVMDLILTVNPAIRQELRERAYLHDRMDYLRAAVEDYQTYLLVAPDCEDAVHVQDRIHDLRQSLQRLH